MDYAIGNAGTRLLDHFWVNEKNFRMQGTFDA